MGSRWRFGLLATLAVASTSLPGCAEARPTTQRTLVVATTPVLAAVVGRLVGDSADVRSLIPNGADPHDWQPSARDISMLNAAALVVANGLGLESGLTATIEAAQADGVRVFTVAEHVTVRTVTAGEAADPDDPDQAPGAEDPHLWTDPLTVAEMIDPLARALADASVDTGTRAAAVVADLRQLDADVAALVASIPVDRRTLVTGHESLGYFASRYGFTVIGAVVPSLSSQAQPSARRLAALNATIRAAGVDVLFTDVGTSAAIVTVVAEDTGSRVVELNTHAVPADGTYRSFILNLATPIVAALAAPAS